MRDNEILAHVTEPTDWVSSMVLVKKPDGTVRICLDPTDLNRAIKRPIYPLPTIEQILPKLKNAKYFSLLDAKNGYWQVELDYNSSILTTFNTPIGRFRWRRLPFGICSASEEYQQRMMQALEGLDGIAIVADDILVYGSGNTNEEASRNHDNNLENLLKRCEKVNLKINKEKLKLKKQELTYIGHRITSEGVKPDENKIQSIK